MTASRRKKIIRWIVGSLLTLILLPFLVLLLLQLPVVQNFVRSKAESYLQKQLKTDVRIGGLRFTWLNAIRLEDVFVGDTRKDTLLSSHELAVKYSIFGLLDNQLKVNSLRWEDAVINVYRPAKDSAFNYQFVIDAFSGAPKEDTIIEESGTTMQFKIGNVELSNINVRFNDSLGGMLASVQLKKLEALPDSIQPENGVYTLRNFMLDGLNAKVQQLYRSKPASAEPAKPADTASSPLTLYARQLEIKNSQWVYGDEGSGLSSTGKIGTLELRKMRFDLLQTLITADELTLKETVTSLDFYKAMDTVKVAVDTANATPNTWKVVAKKIDADGVDFAMNNHLVPRATYTKALDYAHLDIKQLKLDAEDIFYNADSALVTINAGSLQEQSGLLLKTLKGKVRYTPQEAQLQQFILETAETKLDADVAIKAPSWSTLSEQLNMLQINADVRPSTLAMEEALYFIPDMRNNPSLQPIWKKRLALKGQLVGSLAELRIPGLEVKDNDQNYLFVKGTAFEVTDPEKMGADLVNLKVLSSNRGIRSWLPAGTLPASMQLPERMAINGSIRGGMKVLKPDLALTTSLGNANLKGELAEFMDMQKIRYDAALRISDLQLGRILGDTSMGNLTGNITAKGTGTDPNKASAKANAGIQSFTYNRYTYRRIALDASLLKGMYNAKGSINDSSAIAKFEVEGSLDSTHPSIAAKADLDKLDLFATGFTSSPMIIRSCLDAQLDNLAPHKLSGYAAIHKIQITDQEQLYAMDSIMLKARVENGLQHISLGGPFGYIAAKGDFNYQTFASAAGDLITRHLEAESTARTTGPVEKQWLNFDGSISIPKSLRKLFPNFEMPKPLLMEGHLSTDSSLLSMNIAVPTMRIDSFQVDTLHMFMEADTTSMYANILLGHLYHPQIPLQRTTLDVEAKYGTLDWDLLMANRGEKPKYSLGGIVQFLQNDSLLISLKEKLILNRQNWSASGDNRLLIQGGGVAFADIGIQNGAQELKITSSPPSATASTLPDLNVTLKDFRLSTVTSLIEKDTALAEGISNGNITISNMSATPLIDGELKIDSLAVMGSKIGQLALTANTTADKAVRLDATITGNDNDVRLQGTYAEQMDLRLDINKLNMQSVQAFTFGNVTELTGALTGNATLRGTMDKPEIRGNMHFEKVRGRVTAINSIVQLPSEDLGLDAQGMRFNNFVIADSTGNEAVINGQILTRDLEKFQLNLDLNAENFQALGPATKEPEQFFYGPAWVDVRARIRGTLDLPRVEMNVKLREKSNITVAIPEEEPGIASREGIFEFFDPTMMNDTTLKVTDTVRRSGLKGFVFSGDIEVTPDATLKLIIDQSNGDYLEVKGNATLNLTMDPSSKMSLTGRYEINEGKYAMSLSQLIKREFEIEKGSTIIWNGDPLSADVNITARYDVNAVAADLLADQIVATDQTRGRYNQKVPVEVYLKITGELMKPNIAFELDMPEKDQGALSGAVYTRIKQINQVESELNKQVMGLLVLGRFISENPFDQLDTKATSSAEDIARRSVSKVISQQLNNLAGSLIKGFDVNFDLQSSDEYSDAGSRQENTNLKVDVSKKLFSDRLTVSVGSNIGISGQQTASQQNASGLIGDVSAEYTLTPDGRYRVRAYQRSMTEAVVQGQIVETGLTFMLVMDYNEFREIFGKTKKEKKAERLRKDSIK